MVKYKHIIILFITTIILSYGCAPDLFELNKKTSEIDQTGKSLAIYGMILSDLNSVEVINDNSLKIKGGGAVALAVGMETQFSAEFTLKFQVGDVLRFRIRSVSDHYLQHPAVIFDYTLQNSTVSENDILITKVDSIRSKLFNPVKVKISNFGNLMNILVDCDTVYSGTTRLPATEYILLESLRNSEIDVYGINFAKINIL